MGIKRLARNVAVCNTVSNDYATQSNFVRQPAWDTRRKYGGKI